MTNYRLHFRSLDEDPETKDFPDRESAIAYASWWFIDGYTGPEHIEILSSVFEDAGELVSALVAGKEFRCGRLYETVSIELIV